MIPKLDIADYFLYVFSLRKHTKWSCHPGARLPEGNSSVEQKVPLKGLKTPPKRALVNYNYDVLAAY